MNRVNELYEAIKRNAKRVCKTRVPNSLDVRADVEVNLIQHFNELSTILQRIILTVQPEEATQLRRVFSDSRTKIVRSFAKLDLIVGFKK